MNTFTYVLHSQCYRLTLLTPSSHLSPWLRFCRIISNKSCEYRPIWQGCRLWPSLRLQIPDDLRKPLMCSGFARKLSHNPSGFSPELVSRQHNCPNAMFHPTHVYSLLLPAIHWHCSLTRILPYPSFNQLSRERFPTVANPDCFWVIFSVYTSFKDLNALTNLYFVISQKKYHQ